MTHGDLIIEREYEPDRAAQLRALSRLLGIPPASPPAPANSKRPDMLQHVGPREGKSNTQPRANVQSRRRNRTTSPRRPQQAGGER